MPAPVYSIRLIESVLGADNNVTIPVAADQVLVVRHMDAFCDPGAVQLTAPTLFAESIQPAQGNQVTVFWYWVFSTQQPQWAQWTGRQVFEPSNQLRIRSVNHGFNIRVSGYVFAIPPS